MIYSQTSPHNGSVHVSIRADGDASTLTFLDTLWSAVLSLTLSSLFSDLRHAPTWLHSAMHTLNSTATGPFQLFHYQRIPKDSLSVISYYYLFHIICFLLSLRRVGMFSVSVLRHKV